jgi:hypothetical protein
MFLLQGNILTGCLTGPNPAVPTGNYSIGFTPSLGNSSTSFTLPLHVVGQDQFSNGTLYAQSGGVGNLPPSGFQQGVVTPGQVFSYNPGAYGALAPNFAGNFLFGFSGGAPQVCGTASGLSNGISLTAPLPGRYDVLFDGTNQTCQPTPAFPTSPAPLVIDSVDAISTTVNFAGATVSSVSVTNASGQSQSAQNVLDIVQPSSGTTISVSLSFNYTVDQTGCNNNGCIVQIEYGLNTDSGPQSCAYSGGGVFGNPATANVTVTVPNIPGRYYVSIDKSLDFSCLQTSQAWWSGPPSAPRYIAIVDVWAP